MANRIGNSNNNTLNGTGGDDLLDGRGGNDRLNGRGGNDELFGGSGNDTLNGGLGLDFLDGGAGNDVLNPGENNGFGENLTTGRGNDRVILSDMLDGFVNVIYDSDVLGMNTRIIANINGVNNTATVDKGNAGRDIFTDIVNPLNAGFFNGGFSITGTIRNDTYNITLDTEQWMQIRGSAGNDVINVTTRGNDRPFFLDGNTGSLRLDHREADQNMVVNLQTGIISRDGFGGRDRINGNIWEILTGSGNDRVTGSAENESFGLGAGDATLNGGGGVDRLRYDRTGEDNGIFADLNLTQGTVTGSANGQKFSHDVRNIEWLRGSNFDDKILGSGRNDVLDGRDGNDDIRGRAGNDRINGDNGDDILAGDGGNDRINGGNGNDIIQGDAGGDIINGDKGNDFLLGGNGSDRINGGAGNDIIEGGAGNDIINPGDNQFFDEANAGTGNDRYILSDIVDGFFSINYGNDAPDLTGRINATINGVSNVGRVNKGADGTDTFIDIVNPLRSGFFNGGFGLDGTQFNDRYNITLDVNQWMRIRGSEGNDTINVTSRGNDRPFFLDGNNGSLRLDHRQANQDVVADLAQGVIEQDGFGGRDQINGEIWELLTGSGEDMIIGSDANESFGVGAGDASVDGGGGSDRLRYDRTGEDGGINANLIQGIVTGSAEGEQFTHTIKSIEWLRGSEFDDQIIGSGRNDVLEGRGGNDQINGNGGNDRLNGESGNDQINGNAGNDRLNGGSGNDILTGGGGRDKFIFQDNFGRDTIRDFDANNRMEDIDLSAVTAIRNFNDLMNNHIQQVGDDVEIRAGGPNRITIENVDINDLDASDFIF